MAAVPFDTLKLAIRLREKAGFTPGHAEEAAEALADAVGGAKLTTQDDLRQLEASLRGDMRELELRLTIKLGGIVAAATALIVAALRYLPPVH